MPADELNKKPNIFRRKPLTFPGCLGIIEQTFESRDMNQLTNQTPSESDFETGLEAAVAGVTAEGKYGYELHVERLGVVDSAIRQFHGSHLDLIDCLTDADAAGVWSTDGSPSLAEWLGARYLMSRHTARFLARIVEKLPELPQIRRAVADGRLSWDQFRALVEIATPETDADLTRIAPEMTPSQIRATARQISEKEAAEARKDRNVRYWFHDNEPIFEMHLQLPDDEGATFITALTRKAGQLDLDPYDGGVFDQGARLADALVQMASESLSSDADHDRATLLVHTDVNTLLGIGDQAQATLGDGTIIPAGTSITNETLRRLACDARIQLVIEDPTDGVIGIGRTDRSIPPWLARIVRSRDKGCRFPPCGRTVWLHIHHIIHWANGGPTNLENLITLCGFHHRLIHNEGWSIRGNPNGEVTWITKWGTRFERHPSFPGIQYIKEFHSRPTTIEPPPRQASGSIDYSIQQLERSA